MTIRRRNNGLVLFLPKIMEEFIKQLELDALQDRELSIEEFKKRITYFRLSPSDWKIILNDLEELGFIEGYNRQRRKIFFR